MSSALRGLLPILCAGLACGQAPQPQLDGGPRSECSPSLGYTIPLLESPRLAVEICNAGQRASVSVEPIPSDPSSRHVSELSIALQPGEALWGGFCSRDGTHEASLIAVGPVSSEACVMIATARAAWRVSPTSGAIEPTRPEGVVCDSPC